MPEVTFVQSDGQSQSVRPVVGDHLMHAALSADIEGIVGECGGEMSCATCHVYVESPWYDRLTPASGDELDLLEFVDGFRPEASRLSCQIKMADELDGMEMTVAPD
ncbi:2Fe-2S iron-sulfur cluster-binding protein [Actinomycetes bacterium M1A6_2h]